MRGRKKGTNKPQRKPNTYNSYYSAYKINEDGDESMFASGSVKEICYALDITKSTVCKAVKNNSVVRRRYKIYYDGQD